MIVTAFTIVLALGLSFSLIVFGACKTDLTKGRDIWVVDGQEMEQLPKDLENELRKDPAVRDQLDLDDTEELTSSFLELKDEHTITNEENNNESISNWVNHIISFDGTGIDNIVISGENLGIVIDKSLINNFELDYVGINDINKFSIEYLINSDGTLIITAIADSSVNYVNTDPGHKVNVVNIKIPEKTYDSVTLSIEKGGIFLPNIQGNVNIDSDKSLIKVSASQFEAGLKLNLKKSSLKFNVTGISNDIHITGTDSGNSVNMIFDVSPKNLSLDATKCKGSVILPDGWSTDYKVGTDKPVVNLDIKGSTMITVY